MRYRALRNAAVTLLVTAAFVVSPACATLEPPVDFAPQAQTSSKSLDLRVIEGRPDGVLLKLAMTQGADDAYALQLLRAAPDTEAVVYRQIQLQEKLRNALASDGIEFLDRNVLAGQTTRYQLRLIREDESPMAYSELLHVKWTEPPPRPDKLDGRATTPTTVELQWNAPVEHGAVIFRRNVLDQDSSPRRIGEVGPDSARLFVDTDVHPGVVYAYRVSLADQSHGFLQLGPPSEPLYVDVPEP